MLKMLLPELKNEALGLQAYISYADDEAALKRIVSALTEQGLVAVAVEDVSGGWKLGLSANAPQNSKALSQQFRALSEQTGIDIAFVDAKPVPSLEQAGILFMDMDSTLIQCECIDEIADFLGIKDEISSITQRADRKSVV